MWFEWDWNKFLSLQLIEPICEWSVLTSEQFLISSHSSLIIFIMIGCCDPWKMSEIRDAIYLLAFTSLYSSHRSSLGQFSSFISKWYHVKRCILEVNERFLVPIFLLIDHCRFTIGSVSLILHLALFKPSGAKLTRIPYSISSLYFMCHILIITLLPLSINIHGHLIELFSLVSLHRLLLSLREIGS